MLTTKKKSLITIVILTLGVTHKQVCAQEPQLLWSESAGGTLTDEGNGICTDGSGNVYVTGYFNSKPATFGSMTLTNAHEGKSDVFIVKYDSTGDVIWAKQSGGTDNDEGRGITTDASGNVYVTGWFSSDSINFGNTTLTNTGFNAHNIFIVKYGSGGNAIWAKKAGYEESSGIATDASGNVFVTGFTGSKVIVTKYDASGNNLWTKTPGATRPALGNAISTDAHGNAYVTGIFLSPTITFGAITLTNADSMSYDMFVVKYDGNGNAIWAKSAASRIDNAYGTSICTDAAGNVFVTGYFYSDTITLQNITLIKADGNIFVVKYDANGNIIWAKQGRGGRSTSICADAGGNVYLTGAFEFSATFGNINITNQSIGDIFIVKYDANGNEIWGISQGGTGDEVSNGIYTNTGGNVYITGYAEDPSVFGYLPNGGFFEIFVAKLSGGTVSSTGIIENSSVKPLVFPNPVSDYISVELHDKSSKTVFKIFNPLGQLELASTVTNEKVNLDVSGLKRGIHILELRTNKNISRQKFIKG